MIMQAFKLYIWWCRGTHLELKFKFSCSNFDNALNF